MWTSTLVKACFIKGGGHFDMTIHPLFTQNSHTRTHTCGDKWRGNIGIQVVT
jgi:hypothetical protein